MTDASVDDTHFKFINDWPFRRFLLLILGFITLLILFPFVSDKVTDVIYISIFGLILIPFIILMPGAALLRVFKIHGLGFSRSTIYAIAISLFTLMFLGVGLNALHYFDIYERPFSRTLVIGSFTMLMLALTFFAFIRDSGYSPSGRTAPFRVWTLLYWVSAILLPTSIVIASVTADFDGDRSLMFIAVIVICLTPLLLLARTEKHYEVLVLSLSLSLLLHRGLITNYLMGYDIFSEYYAAYTTTVNGYWDMTVPNGAFTALSMVTLAPMLTNLTGINTIYILKAVYPVIFSFVALGLYKVVESQFGKNVAMAATLLFIGYQGFFGLMIQLTKQQIAEVFLLIILLALSDATLSRKAKRILVLMSAIGVVVSHYAIAYLIIGVLVGVIFFNSLWLLVDELKKRKNVENSNRLINWFRSTIIRWYRDQRRSQVISFDLIILFLVFFYIWYSLTASGIMLGYAENSQDYIGPSESGGIKLYQLDALEFLLIDYGTNLHNVEKYLVLFSQAISVIGVIYVLSKWRDFNKMGVSKDFVSLGIVGSLTIIACYLVPRFSYSFYFGRFFHFTYIFISGFFLIGLYAIVHYFDWRKGARDRSISIGKKSPTMIVGAVFLTFFLLLNTSALYHATGTYDTSFSLNSNVGWSIYSDPDVLSAKWVGQDTLRDGSPVVADWHRFPIYGGMGVPIRKLTYQWTTNQTDSIIYLSTWNVKTGWTYSWNVNGSSRQSYTPFTEISSQVNTTDVIYSTGGSAKILYIPEQQPDTNPVGPPINKYEASPMYILAVSFGAGVGLFLLVWMIRWKKGGRMKGTMDEIDKSDEGHHPYERL